MRGSAKGLARAMLMIADWLIPKSESTVMCSVPAGDDQIAEMIRVWSPHTNHITVLIPSGQEHARSALSDLGPVSLVRKNTLTGVLTYLRARYVFFTHGLYMNPKPPSRKLVVNLWHGNPVKQVGLDAGEEPILSTAAITTTSDYVPILGRTFGIGSQRVWVTGLPRADAMVRAAGSALKESRPRVLWLPTFRDWELGRSLGVDELVHLSGANAPSLRDMFQELGMQALVRAHPLVGSVEEYRSDALTVARGDVLDGQRLSGLLADADVLVTDISSVWQEFLILDRPIIFAASDLAALRQARGLYQVDAQWLGRAGPVVTTLGELRVELQEIACGRDPWEFGRESARLRLHAHADGKSSERVLECIRRWQDVQESRRLPGGMLPAWRERESSRVGT